MIIGSISFYLSTYYQDDAKRILERAQHFLKEIDPKVTPFELYRFGNYKWSVGCTSDPASAPAHERALKQAVQEFPEMVLHYQEIRDEWYGRSAPVEQSITIDETMNVEEFGKLFDDFLGGKAIVRVWRDKQRLTDTPLKEILKLIQLDEICLSDTLTVAEAEKQLTECFIDGVWVDIYPRYHCYRLSKDLPIGEIRQIRQKIYADSFSAGASDSMHPEREPNTAEFESINRTYRGGSGIEKK